jgi:YARHG domain
MKMSLNRSLKKLMLKNIKNHSFLILPILLIFGCNKTIKDNTATIENEIDSTISGSVNTKVVRNDKTEILKKEDLIGFWVGDFANAEEDNGNKNINADEGLYWQRNNKITISIDSIVNQNIIGHSVVAGNNRPFKGNIVEDNTQFSIEVLEPGDDKYDGKFNFTIQKNDNQANGTWKSFKKIEIENRKYNLRKKIYKYDLNKMLIESKTYGDWTKSKNLKTINDDTGEFKKTFAASTNLIYELNASNTLFSKKDVENLKKGDLLIIRNTIYARHGYSFKNRPLRVFFDAQEWYIPVNTDIKSDLTDIEKQNIQLLLKYEKNAKEYYDYFGRG